MISLNTVIENFNRVYQDRSSPEKHFFLNSCLEITENKSQKASFFDIVDALQSRKWELTSETDTAEVSKKIKKLWLQTKFIYDNEPFSIRSASQLINLFDKSITEATFSNPTKLEEYAQQVQNYCEILYISNLIVQAEERLANLSENIGFPTNLKKYYESLELKYEKVLAFQNTPEFQFLKSIKYTNPLLYLSVFIEEGEEQIHKIYPGLVEFFELAERFPTHNKKKKSAKKLFTPEQIRNRLLTIVKNSPKETKKTNNKQLLPFIYSVPKNSKLNWEEYYNLIKGMEKSHNDVTKTIEKNLQRLEEALAGLSTQDGLIPDMVTITASLLIILKEDLFAKNNTLPVLTSLPLAQTQSSYTQGLKKYIEMFRKIYTPLQDKSSTRSTILVTTDSSIYKMKGTKSEFLKNRSEKFGQSFMKFVNAEIEIFKEHFPTLYKQPDYLSSTEITLQVKKEVAEARSTYSILIKELSKIALASTSAQKKSQEISPEYRQFLDLLVSDSKSLPSPEEFISLNLKHPFDDFFSRKEIETLDQLITNFKIFQQKIIHEKVRTYCEEYRNLKSQEASLKRPPIRSEESFVSQVEVEEEEVSCSAKQADLKISIPSSPEESKLPESLSYINDEKEGVSSIVERCSATLPEEFTLSTTTPSSTGAIPKRTLSQKTYSSQKVSKSPENLIDNIRALSSLRQLRSVEIRKKLSKFHYHDRIKRWVFDSKTALSNPAYKNLTKTKSNKKETVAFHAFPKIIDGLLGTNYCQEEESRDSRGDLLETYYSIPATIIMQDIKHEGYFEYTINDKQICYHRCFSPERKSAANKALYEDFSSDKYFSHEKMHIQCDPNTHTIRIDNPIHEMEIFIFPLSTNN